MVQATELPRYQKHYQNVLGKRMAYIDEGQGDPIVFLHGNPTSSFLWRNIMPFMEGRGRLIAPDLIGMGDSDKLDHSGPDSYTYLEHRRYLFALLEQLEVNANVTLVVHDWGSGLGFHWAHQHPDVLKGIAFMEAIVAPMQWQEFPAGFVEIFEGFRSAAGESLVLDDNLFVEQVLPGAVLRDLTDAEMDEYRRPFAQPGEHRRPTLTWPRQLPLDGEPEEVVQIVAAYSQWLGEAKVAKLFVNAEPGGIVTGSARALVRTWPNLQEFTVPGIHFIQEDSADQIGAGLADWYQGLAG